MVVSCWKGLLLLPVLCVLSVTDPSSFPSSSSSSHSPSSFLSSHSHPFSSISSSSSSFASSSSSMSGDLDSFQGDSTANTVTSASAKDAGIFAESPLILQGDASSVGTVPSPSEGSASREKRTEDAWGISHTETSSDSLSDKPPSITKPHSSSSSRPTSSSSSPTSSSPPLTSSSPPPPPTSPSLATSSPSPPLTSSSTTSSPWRTSSSPPPPPSPKTVSQDTTAHGSEGASSPSERVAVAQKKVSVRDERVLKAVEANLLGALGLSSRPRPSRDRFVPPYMLELYHHQQQQQQQLLQLQQQGKRRRVRVGPSSSSRAASLGIDSPFLKVAGRGGMPANTVRSFHHTDHGAKKGCDDSTCSRLLFNTSSIPHTESLAAAELRLYLDLGDGLEASLPSQGQGRARVKAEAGERSGSGRRRGGEHQHAFKVEVHEIMHMLAEGEEEDCISRLLDTKVIGAKDAGKGAWVSFDIHPAVLKWTRGQARNKGLEVRLLPRRLANASLDSHVRVRRSAGQSEDVWQRHRPLLVTYTDDGRGALNSAPQRTKRSSAAQSERKREKRRRKKNRKGNKARRNRRKKKRRRKKKKKTKTRKGDKNLCRRHPLYVDFEDVGWKDWIQAPEGFNAYFCHGDCNFPLPHHLNSTNHAIVRTLVNSVDPKAVPKACCVPTELSAISMLYTNEWDKTILKIYKDMVVEACGCR